MDQFLGHIMLLLGVIFTFFIAGFVFIETFLPHLNRLYKLPLYMLTSVIFSTYTVYLVSLVMGFSRLSILVAFGIFLLWLAALGIKRRKITYSFPKSHALAVFASFLVFLVYFIALLPAIFSSHNDYYVLAIPNWQDTAMHLGIIESVAQGNFPPQAPYYAGESLNYYYFTNLHSSILVALKGEFFPKVLVIANPFFAMIFFLSLYVLGWALTRSKKASFIAAFIGTFFSNMIFLNFFRDLFAGGGNTTLFAKLVDMFANRSYSMEYEGLFQMATMADYFLQNRPMMVGLPAVSLIALLLYKGYQKKSRPPLIIAGVLAASLAKFQFFALGVSITLLAMVFLVFYKKGETGKGLSKVLLFLLPVFATGLILLTTSVGGNNLSALVLENLSFGSWDRELSVWGHLQFIFFNLGLPFILAAGVLVAIFTKLFHKKRVRKEQLFLVLWAGSLFMIPYLTRFTIYPGDMFKFFYFLVIPMSILTGLVLSRLSSKAVWGMTLTVLIIIISTASSFLTLANSFYNKNFAYSREDFETGIWIRENTPQGTVFISLPTVHTPITQIGGRLRVLSYINWPYSHGYNSGEDNVFSRLNDVERFYEQSQVVQNLLNTIDRYKIDYIYYGREEKDKFPDAAAGFDERAFLKKVYNTENVLIYEIVKD